MTRALDVAGIVTVAALIGLVAHGFLAVLAESRRLDDHRPIRTTPEPPRVTVLHPGPRPAAVEGSYSPDAVVGSRRREETTRRPGAVPEGRT